MTRSFHRSLYPDKSPVKTGNYPADEHPKINIFYLLLTLGIGGLENGVINLINHSRDEQFRHMVCCLRHRGPMEQRIERNNVPIFSLNFKAGNDFRVSFRLAHLMRKQNVHLVRCMNSEAFLYGFIAAKLARVPVLIYSNGGRSFDDRSLRRWVERVFSRYTDQITVVSEDLKNKMIFEMGIEADKILVMDNGVELDRFIKKEEAKRHKLLKDLGLPRDIKIIGTVGRLVPEKDYPTLLRAFAIVSHAIPSSRLLIVGDGIMGDALLQLAHKLQIEDKVLFLGYQSDIPLLLSIMDVFVLPSVSEGFSNVILEAMASSLPVVATNVGANRRIVLSGETGYITRPGDVNQIAEHILTLLQSTSLALAMGRKGRQHVEDVFSIGRMVENYEERYRILLRNKGLLT